MSVWIDGKVADCISVQDRGLLYGDGFFTTACWQDGMLLNWAAHRQRLRRSADVLGFPADTFMRVEAQLKAMLPDWPREAAVVRITLTRGEGARGYTPPQRASMRCIVQVLPGLPADEGPLTVCLSEVHWPQQPALAGIKHLNRLPQVLAAQQLPPQCDEALMQDARHRLISGISCALVCRLGKTLYSPMLDTAGVDSTTVNALRHAAQQLGWQWQTIHLPVGRLLQMEGVALLNAVRGLQPVAVLKTPLEKTFDVDGWAPLAEALARQQRETAWDGS